MDWSVAGAFGEAYAGVREARRVSWMPGAEGAPLDVGTEPEWVVRLVVEEGWEEDGAIRRD